MVIGTGLMFVTVFQKRHPTTAPGAVRAFVFFALLILISFAYLTYRDFKLALTVLLALLPMYLIRFNVGPVPTTLLECLVLVILGFWFFKERGRMLQ